MTDYYVAMSPVIVALLVSGKFDGLDPGKGRAKIFRDGWKQIAELFDYLYFTCIWQANKFFSLFDLFPMMIALLGPPYSARKRGCRAHLDTDLGAFFHRQKTTG